MAQASFAGCSPERSVDRAQIGVWGQTKCRLEEPDQKTARSFLMCCYTSHQTSIARMSLRELDRDAMEFVKFLDKTLASTIACNSNVNAKLDRSGQMALLDVLRQQLEM